MPDGRPLVRSPTATRATLRRFGPSFMLGLLILGCGAPEPGEVPRSSAQGPADAELAVLYRQQRTPEWAAMQRLHAAVSRGDAAAVRAHLKRGVSVDARDVEGSAPLMLSARLGDLDLVELLLSNGADPDAQNLFRGTALMEAARMNHAHVVQRLLQAGAYANARNGQGQSALYLAASNGHAGVVKALLLAGADPGSEGLGSPLRTAAYHGHWEVVELLEDAKRRR